MNMRAYVENQALINANLALWCLEADHEDLATNFLETSIFFCDNTEKLKSMIGE